MNGVRTLLTGRGLVESPRWHGDRLYFSDWSAGEVLAVDLAGHSEVIARVDSLPLCTAWLPDDRLVIVSSPDGRLLRREPGGIPRHPCGPGHAGVERHRDRRPWQRLRQPGRLQPDGRGGVPAGLRPSGHPGRLGAPGCRRHRVPQRDGGHRGQRHADRRGLLPALPGCLRHRLRRRAVRPRVWADLGTGVPDGICTDAENAVWYADVPGKRCVRVAAGGAVLQTVELDRGGFACALGGPGNTTLFIVAAEWQGMTGPEPVPAGSGQVLAVEVEVPGAGWP